MAVARKAHGVVATDPPSFEPECPIAIQRLHRRVGEESMQTNRMVGKPHPLPIA
jgi:hypothetical protein